MRETSNKPKFKDSNTPVLFKGAKVMKYKD